MSAPPVSAPPVSLRILVVENHPDTLHYLRIFLEDMGHVVTSAGTMAESLRHLAETDCDAIISDIGLPDGNGWDLLRRANLPRPVYAIAMSGFGMHADQAHSRAAGYRHHLLKPFAPGLLEDMLDEAARERAAAR